MMEGIETILARLVQVRIDGEVWLNGSFVTEKNEPEDADLLVCVSNVFHDEGTNDQIDALIFVETIDPSYLCQGILLLKYAENHPDYHMTRGSLDHFEERWGKNRAGTPKGVVVVKFPCESEIIMHAAIIADIRRVDAIIDGYMRRIEESPDIGSLRVNLRTMVRERNKLFEELDELSTPTKHGIAC